MRLTILHLIARAIGLQFHVDGFPYGAKVARTAGVGGCVTSTTDL